MLLSKLINTKIYAGETLRGVCLGVGISLKTQEVKYLLCANFDTYNPLCPHVDFAISTASIESVCENKIILSRLRPTLTQNCSKVFLQRPVFSNTGAFLGKISDMDLTNFIATRFFTDALTSYPVSAIAAFADAVLLKKQPPYPLGQLIPENVTSNMPNKTERIVTKTTLKGAIHNRSLIKFTLSLAPFSYIHGN